MGDFKDLLIVVLGFVALTLIITPETIPKIVKYYKPCEEEPVIPYYFNVTIALIMSLVAWKIYNVNQSI